MELLIDNVDAIVNSGTGVQDLKNLVVKLALHGYLSSESLNGAGLSSVDGSSKYELPDGWSWVKFGDIASFNVGRTPPTKDPSYWGGRTGIPWISIADMKQGESVTETKKFVTDKSKTETFRRDPWPAGTLLMSFKLTIGKVSRLSVPAYFNEAIFAFDTGSVNLNEYLFRVLPIVSTRTESKGAIKGNTLNSTSISGMDIPLPTEAHQEVIIKRIDELNSICDEIGASKQNRDLLRSELSKSLIASII